MARDFRSNLYLDIPNYRAAVDDMVPMTADPDFQTPCLYRILAMAYDQLDMWPLADDANSKVIELSTVALETDPKNGFTYYMRGVAEEYLAGIYRHFAILL